MFGNPNLWAPNSFKWLLETLENDENWITRIPPTNGWVKSDQGSHQMGDADWVPLGDDLKIKKGLAFITILDIRQMVFLEITTKKPTKNWLSKEPAIAM